MTLPLSLALPLWLLPPVAAADPAPPCVRAAADAAAETGVPFAVLLAIAQTETGRGSGETATWPWAVNDAGESHYFPTRADAVAGAEEALAEGRTSFDLGCFQLNYRWHGADFASVDSMLDPAANALHAARFLAELHAETGDWSLAAGAYHSRDATLAARYRSRFDAFLVAAADPAPDPAPSQREGSFPLLRQSEGRRALASLVPLDL